MICKKCCRKRCWNASLRYCHGLSGGRKMVNENVRIILKKIKREPEDGGSTVLLNVGILSQHYVASQPRRP
jgi:hypothetical protein